MASLLGDERGALLAELVVVIGVLTMLGTALLSSLQTSILVTDKFEDASVAENILRNQLAYVSEQDFVPPGGTYLTVDSAYLGFDPAEHNLTVTVEVGRLNLETYEAGCPYDPGDETDDRSKICIQVAHPTRGVIKSIETARISN